MAKITCSVSEVTLENDDGREIPGVQVTCGKCGHTEESFGTSDRSVTRCLCLMRENCPEGEDNYYTSG